MKIILFIVCTGIFFFAVSEVNAVDKVVVPLFEKAEECCVCAGTSDGTRWCFNGDGTITDRRHALYGL